MTLLDSKFFQKDAEIVAKNLLGKVFHFYEYEGIICETESYDQFDPASHSFGGKISKRNSVMFAAAGCLYIYLIYGMYYCLNIVTGQQGEGSAVLIRALYFPKNKLYVGGPGKICRYLNIDKKYNGMSIINNHYIFITDEHQQYPFEATPRIGISKGTDLLKRFVISPSQWKDR